MMSKLEMQSITTLFYPPKEELENDLYNGSFIRISPKRTTLRGGSTHWNACFSVYVKIIHVLCHTSYIKTKSLSQNGLK